MQSRLRVQTENVQFLDKNMLSTYIYNYAEVEKTNDHFEVVPKQIKYTFKTDLRVPKTGIMLVGLGGNNGTTLTAGILANKHKIYWETKKGTHKPNWFGSITQSSTTKIGISGNKEIYLPLKEILPLVDPNDLYISGWDISSVNLADAMKRAQVLDHELQKKLNDYMKSMVPLPGIYYEDFIALNQKERADNVLPGQNKMEHLEKIRKDIRNFKESNKLDKVLVLWTANTERYCEIKTGVHDTAENFLKAIEKNESEISPSSVYAAATILEGCSFINGSPQNTFVPGLIELAQKKNVFIIGDDFKSGQTKFKTVLAEFLVGAGIKPTSIVSYNHLGNNDGYNLSSDKQFRSKEISKSSCVDDILKSNEILYEDDTHIDHTIVIKYNPSTGDTKKALDEYTSEIFMGGSHVLSLYNVCEDSLLAAPIILDLLILTEIFERITWKQEEKQEFKSFHTILSTLGYLCKAPLTDSKAPLINALSRQKAGIENIFKVCAGLPIDDNLLLEYRCNSFLIFQLY